MGCSYDHPAPSDEVVKLGNDGFIHHKFSPPASSTCTKCGALITGGPFDRRFIDLHVEVCPGRVEEAKPSGVNESLDQLTPIKLNEIMNRLQIRHGLRQALMQEILAVQHKKE